MCGLRKMAAWFAAHRERFGVLGIGLLGNTLMVFAFDMLLYPYVVWKFGIVKGGIIMTILSFLACYATILFYDWTKKDWLGIETMKGLKEYDGDSRMGHFISWIMKKSDPIVMIFLSLKFDPFITMVYMRHGAYKYNGMNKRDWKIFVSSLFIANIFWTLVSFAGVSIVEYVWKFF